MKLKLNEGRDTLCATVRVSPCVSKLTGQKWLKTNVVSFLSSIYVVNYKYVAWHKLVTKQYL